MANRCRCTAYYKPDGTCPHGCAPPSQKRLRRGGIRRAEGVRERPDKLLGVPEMNRALGTYLDRRSSGRKG